MFVFGHAGITLGAAALAGAGNISPSRLGRLRGFVARLDLRLMALAALLPDAIDKPLGHYILADRFDNGRIFAHTLLFTLLLTILGIWLYRRRHRVWGLTLAIGCAGHLILDAMWRTPQTLFWPAYGWQFPRLGAINFWNSIWEALMSSPAVYVPEIIGLVVLAVIGLIVIKRRRLGDFLKSGRIIES